MTELQRKTAEQRKELLEKESTLQRARHLRDELENLQTQKVKFQRQIKEDSVRARTELHVRACLLLLLLLLLSFLLLLLLLLLL